MRKLLAGCTLVSLGKSLREDRRWRKNTGFGTLTFGQRVYGYVVGIVALSMLIF